MKNIIFLCLLFLSFFSLNAQPITSENQVVVFLVRHAEKVDSSRDAELSEAGKERAQELAETLKSANIDFIHSTDFIRTRNTANPLAEAVNKPIGIYDYTDLEDFAELIKNKGGRHLVVGHSNTTPRLVKLLGGEPGEPIVEKNEYDRLYILSWTDNEKVSTVLLRYGKKFESD